MPASLLVLWFLQHDGNTSVWLSLALASNTSHVNCRQINCPHCHSTSKGIVCQSLIYVVLISPRITVCSFFLMCLTSVLHLIARLLFWIGVIEMRCFSIYNSFWYPNHSDSEKQQVVSYVLLVHTTTDASMAQIK